MQLLRKHVVFVIALLVGLLVFLLLTTREVNARNLLAGWNVSALLFIAATWWRMLRASVEKIRKRSADLDFSDSLLLFLSIAAALASIAGIGLELHQVKGCGARRGGRTGADSDRDHPDFLGVPAHAVHAALRASLLWRR
jgi:uncharacterized membrane protein